MSSLKLGLGRNGMYNHQWKHGYAPKGQKKPGEYYSWLHMRQHCNNPKAVAYKDYGGRGIGYCERWEVFENFFVDMGPKPGPNYTLGRIDNNDDYYPENCRWETRTQQGRNTRRVRLSMVDAREIRMYYNRGWTKADLAREYNVGYSTITHVINNVTWKERTINK